MGTGFRIVNLFIAPMVLRRSQYPTRLKLVLQIQNLELFGEDAYGLALHGIRGNVSFG
jgi:hypothetical protein